MGKGGRHNGIDSAYQKRAPTFLGLLCHMRISLRGRDHSLFLGSFPRLHYRENINTHFFVIKGTVPGPQKALKCLLNIPMRQYMRQCFVNTGAALLKLVCQSTLNAEERVSPSPSLGVWGESHPTGSLKGLLSKRRTYNAFAFNSVIYLDLSK